MKALLAYSTVPNETTAEVIARTIVGERLAACANIIPGMRSLYWWAGALEEAHEVVLLFKTRRDLADKLSARIKELHPYECPCIVLTDIRPGYLPYFEWLVSETD